MIVKGRCDDGFIWNSSVCECECNESCDAGEFLDFENGKCRKRLIDKLVEECSEKINANEMVKNVTLNDHGKVWESCTICIVLLIITFIIITDIGSIYSYFC